MTTPPPAGWHPDPTGRHELRYSDGAQWTEHVADGQATAVDPYTAPMPPPPAPPIPPPAAAAAPAAEPGTMFPDPTTPMGEWSQPADPQQSPTAETPVASEPAVGWPDYGQAPATDRDAAAAWSSIDEPIAPDPTTAFPSPGIGQAPGAPTSFQAPPAYAAPPPGAVPAAAPPASGGGTRWGLIALIALLVVGAIGAGVFALSNLSDDDADDGVADDPAEVIPEFGEDAQLDNLARACENGDWDSCDDLYWESGFESGYEDYGNTCGGRNPPTQDYCANLY